MCVKYKPLYQLNNLENWKIQDNFSEQPSDFWKGRLVKSEIRSNKTITWSVKWELQIGQALLLI